MMAALCVRLAIWVGSWPNLPPRADLPAASMTICALNAYRVLLSKRSGRACLFEESCSRRALAAIKRNGFSRGMREVGLQLRRCGGEYTVIRRCDGQRVLITSDGMRFEEHELSQAAAL